MATYLGVVGLLINKLRNIYLLSLSVKIFSIGEYLAKLQAKM